MPTRDPAKRREIYRRYRERHAEKVREAKRLHGLKYKARRLALRSTPEGRERWREQKRQQRYKNGATPLAERKAKAKQRAEERAQNARQPRLPKLLPHIWRVAADIMGLRFETVRFRWRYRSDESFRAKQILRRLARDYPAQPGDITPRELATIFAAAKHCHYCERTLTSQQKTADHVLPRSRGGRHVRENIVIACRSCNCSKSARTPQEWSVTGPGTATPKGVTRDPGVCLYTPPPYMASLASR